MTTSRWRTITAKVRKRFPVETPVTIRRKKMSDAGLTTFDGRQYHIYIDFKQNDSAQVETLLHEWGHVIAMEQAFKHKGPWGKIYGNIYEWWFHGSEEEEEEEEDD